MNRKEDLISHIMFITQSIAKTTLVQSTASPLNVYMKVYTYVCRYLCDLHKVPFQLRESLLTVSNKFLQMFHLHTEEVGLWID